jgi:hypothetical protein
MQIYNLVLLPARPPLLSYEPPLLLNEPPMLPDESPLLQNEPPLLCVYSKATAFHKCFLKETVVWIGTWVFHRPQKYPWNPKSVSDLEARPASFAARRTSPQDSPSSENPPAALDQAGHHSPLQPVGVSLINLTSATVNQTSTSVTYIYLRKSVLRQLFAFTE